MKELVNAPPVFQTDDGKTISFAKFHSAQHHLRFDVGHYNSHPDEEPSADAQSRIEFDAGLPGSYVVVDLFAYSEDDVQSVQLDGSPVGSFEVDVPLYEGKESARYRVLDQPIAPGRHVVEIRHRLRRGITRTAGGFTFRLEMWDQEPKYSHQILDRSFLSRYLPANLEFDRYPISMTIEIDNAPTDYVVLSNDAHRTTHGWNFWSLDYPPYFSVSCPFLYIAEDGTLARRSFPFWTSDGSAIDVTIACTQENAGLLDAYQMSVWNALCDLDRRFGPFPHPRLLVLDNGRPAMEYAGAATVGTRGGVVPHELTHSYFGRCVKPTDGNAGWVDEAVAKWVEGRYQRLTTEPAFESAMGNRSPHLRWTDRDAWDVGGDLVAYLDHALADRGGMTGFLRDLVSRRRHDSLTAREFEEELCRYAGRDFYALLERTVHGNG